MRYVVGTEAGVSSARKAAISDDGAGERRRDAVCRDVGRSHPLCRGAASKTGPRTVFHDAPLVLVGHLFASIGHAGVGPLTMGGVAER